MRIFDSFRDLYKRICEVRSDRVKCRMNASKSGVNRLSANCLSW